MSTKTAAKTSRNLSTEVEFLTRALKAPTLHKSVARLAERARAESWTHEEYLVACLQREVSARESHGGQGRIRAARFPARKSLEVSVAATVTPRSSRRATSTVCPALLPAPLGWVGIEPRGGGFAATHVAWSHPQPGQGRSTGQLIRASHSHSNPYSG